MKVAIVTGASRGIGKSIAREVASSDVGVIATYNSNPAGAQEVVDVIEKGGGSAVALRLDVSDSASFDGFVTTVRNVLREKWSRPSFDYLVNNAGVGGFNPIVSVTEREFDHLMNVHLRGPFFLTQKLLTVMADGGSIVNVTSATTRVATVGVAPYASMKGGLEVLTRYLAKELGERKIRANAISPGAIRTDLGGGIDNYPELEKMLASQTALGRIGEPVDVGAAVAALLSDAMRWVNGQIIEVGGGYMI